MRQTERINNSSSSLNFRCFEWLLLLLLLWIAPSFTLTQYASSTYNSQYYGNTQQQQQQQQQVQQQQLQLQQLQRGGYPDAPLTYTYQYPAAGIQSVWSSAPIVVNDEANTLEQERQQQQQQQEQSYLPINYYNNRELDRRQTNRINNNNNNHYIPTTTRAANHNNNNIPGYFYYPQTQSQPQSQQELEQRELLTVADSRREEEQIVRIGGIRSLALNPLNNNNAYYEPSQPWRRNNLEAKYAKHYSEYLSKYPQRLQPLYNYEK